jgi:hypothetical protein
MNHNWSAPPYKTIARSTWRIPTNNTGEFLPGDQAAEAWGQNFIST